MGFLKNYLKPGSDAKKTGKTTTDAPAPTMSENSGAGSISMPQSALLKGSAPGSGVPTPWLRSGATSPAYGSRAASRDSSPFPRGDFRNSTMDDILDIKCDVMVNWLHQQQLEAMWTANGPGEGVVLKRSRGRFIACPNELTTEEDGFFDAVRQLNVRTAITVNTRVIKLFLSRCQMQFVPLQDGLRLQVLDSIADLPKCQKHHFAAFIRDTSLLVVWDDDPRFVLDRARKIENQLMAMIWEADEPRLDDEKEGMKSQVTVQTFSEDGEPLPSEASEDITEAPRKIKLNQPVTTALTLALLIAAVGAGWRNVVIEIATDKSMLRLAFIAVVPLQCWLALFFMQSVIGNLIQMLGPVSQVKQNSKFYSGIRPTRIRRAELPHVTVQCPVYKEGLKGVIEPTIKSVKNAISTYEMQGGTANIFINDDGMQLIPEDEAQARRDFYDEHNIGWVARPKHNPKPAEGEVGFVRTGKFKKASNMNYALAVSTRVEDKLGAIERPNGWTGEDEVAAYNDCLAQVMVEDEGRTWAEGNIRIGDYILIIDSDTRVPADCFLDGVSEMEQSPQVAIIQFSSGVMNITQSFFENGITFFTNLIYTAIEFAVANGDVAPFVGHNAMLRWSAVQDVAAQFDNPADAYGGTAKYWSEATVSEDFDMALRLQSAGYIVRFAAYTGDGFKEGVSLTVYDELARWEKYAYGCNELIFHPVRYWFTKGPFTGLFRRFIASRMPLPSKFTIMAYIGTYYALGSAWLLTLMNYFLIGWFNGYLDHYYLDSFKVYFSILVVFTALGNVSLAVYRYRLGERNLFAALWENFKWVFLMSIFFGGVSVHVSQALLSHMFGIDMSWGATSKEAENVSFFEEVPRLLKSFKGTFIASAMSIAMMVILGVAPFVPAFWHINIFIAIFPLALQTACHVLLPIALNPNLMLFTW